MRVALSRLFSSVVPKLIARGWLKSRLPGSKIPRECRLIIYLDTSSCADCQSYVYCGILATRAHFLQLGRAIAHRKRTFLEEDSWKLSCLIDGDVPQEPVHQLLDIWTAIPGLLEDSDALLADRSKREHRVEEAEEDFLRRLRLTMTRMFSWRWQFERRFPGAAYEKQVVRGRSITVDDAGAPLFDTVLFYEHLHQGARPITMYNLALLQLMHIASSWKILDLPAQALASMDIRTTSAHAGPLLLPHEHLSLKDVSQEVCRSIEYHLLDDHDSNGAM